jgi:hypothetical protein
VRSPALVAVDDEPAAFAPLFDAARAAGLRVGWLDLRAGLAPAASAALDSGAAKAVEVADGRVAAVKRVAGPSVLRDLVREHFLGHAVVLVRGLDGSPRLATADGGFRFADAAGERRLDAASALAELARPRHRLRRQAR